MSEVNLESGRRFPRAALPVDAPGIPGAVRAALREGGVGGRDAGGGAEGVDGKVGK